ncbi:hypothetical protein ACFQV2_21135 [Actinokineospora soli]|uniref:Uncharacterized protein n=1 Tax=Actinokineospora soli TaxID=1048753 RepID=A0ABW2TRV7_9PSEU
MGDTAGPGGDLRGWAAARCGAAAWHRPRTVRIALRPGVSA